MKDPETDELLNEVKWELDINSNLLALPIYAPESEFKTQRLLSLGMLCHLGSFALAFLSMLIHALRRCGKCMRI